MRVPPNEFVADLPRYFLDRETTLRASDLGMHHDLEKKVAQLFAQIRVVLPADRVRHFIRFLEQARDERFVCLFAVPWTAVRGSQARHDLAESVKLRMHRNQIRQSERWLPNSEISPEVLRPT